MSAPVIIFLPQRFDFEVCREELAEAGLLQDEEVAVYQDFKMVSHAIPHRVDERRLLVIGGFVGNDRGFTDQLLRLIKCRNLSLRFVLFSPHVTSAAPPYHQTVRMGNPPRTCEHLIPIIRAFIAELEAA